MRKIKKGSFTIEAALLMPLVLMILIGVLYLDFFVHDRAYLTAAAYEAAVSGSMEGYKKKGNIYEKADIQGRMLGDIGPVSYTHLCTCAGTDTGERTCRSLSESGILFWF